MRYRLPVPSSWQDFEALCHMLWKEVWADPNTQRVGRPGQTQDGLDVVGRPVYWGRLAGVQCKDRDGRLGSHLTSGQLEDAVKDAMDFEPRLSQFTLATTAPNDAAIQKAARTMRGPAGSRGSVHVWSWDEIEAEVVCRPQLMRHFYSQFPLEIAPGSVKISVSAPRDQFHAYFSRPALRNVVPEPLRARLLQICYELSDNAFTHGRASHVEISFNGIELVLQDNGAAFNPLSQLEHLKAGANGHIGSLVMHRFTSDFSRYADFAYAAIEGPTGRVNRLSVKFISLPQLPFPEVLDLPVDVSAMFGRRGAEQYADSVAIHPNANEVILTFTEDYAMSGISMFIFRMRERLLPAVKLVASYPRNSLIGHLTDYGWPGNVQFRPR